MRNIGKALGEKNNDNDMITECSKLTLVSEDEILGGSRKQEIVDVRHVYFLLLNERGFTHTKIGILSDFDHSSVTHGINRVKTLLNLGDKKITRLYNLIKDIKR
jgi:chromosomal replication initiation ATPase DnaA